MVKYIQKMQFSDCRMPSRVEDIEFIICEQ